MLDSCSIMVRIHVAVSCLSIELIYQTFKNVKDKLVKK